MPGVAPAEVVADEHDDVGKRIVGCLGEQRQRNRCQTRGHTGRGETPKNCHPPILTPFGAGVNPD